MAQLPVVYLAAGRGSRLGGLTADRPKALIEIGGRTLIERALTDLREAGFDRVVAVTGHAAELLGSYDIESVFNSHWHDQNNIVSLWQVRDVVATGCLIVNCDVLFESAIATVAASARGTSLLVDDVTPVDEESMKVVLEGERLVRLHKSVPLGDAVGEYIGLTRVDPSDGPRFAEILEEFVARGEVGVYYEDALEQLAKERAVTIERVGGLAWIEIDDNDDLTAAAGRIAPLIDAADGVPSR